MAPERHYVLSFHVIDIIKKKDTFFSNISKYECPILHKMVAHASDVSLYIGSIYRALRIHHSNVADSIQ